MLLYKYKTGIHLHASCIAKYGQAIMIIGAAGSGKTRLCWHMMQQGYQLIADDIVNLNNHGFCTATTANKGLLYLRNHGFIRVKDEQLCEKAKLSLIINLNKLGKKYG